MTPDQARRLLEGTTPGPWEWEDCIGDGGVRHMALRNPAGEKAVITEDAESYQSGVSGTPEDLRLTAAAPVLAAMIAGMREEWGVSYRLDHENEKRTTWGFPTRAAAEEWEKKSRNSGSDRERIVRRYVTEPEEA